MDCKYHPSLQVVFRETEITRDLKLTDLKYKLVAFQVNSILWMVNIKLFVISRKTKFGAVNVMKQILFVYYGNNVPHILVRSNYLDVLKTSLSSGQTGPDRLTLPIYAEPMNSLLWKWFLCTNQCRLFVILQDRSKCTPINNTVTLNNIKMRATKYDKFCQIFMFHLIFP